MRLEGVCCRSHGQPCSERKRSTMATSRRKDSPSGVGCPGGDWEDSGPVVAMVYLVCTVSLSRADDLSALRGIARRCYTSHAHDASLHDFSVFLPSPAGRGERMGLSKSTRQRTTMQLQDFDFPLPPELIAQVPAARRDQARLMVVDRAQQRVTHDTFANIGHYLHAGDVLVVNDTKV